MKRSKLAAVLGGLMLLGLVSVGSVLGAVDYATVTGHQAFSADANHEDYWGKDCSKIEDVEGSLGSSYVLTNDYDLVVVKAGSDAYANTLFANATAGQTVWADTNGNNTFDPGGQDGDKGISHIIFCGPAPEETPAVTPEATPEATPAESPAETPEATPAETPAESPEATPAESPEATPAESPAETPEATPAETPAETPEATPAETPDGTPAASPSGGVLGETDSPGLPTGPSTDIGSGDGPAGGVNMGIVLLALGALAIVTLLVTPVPAKVRDRNRNK
jgi:hypothetical protein